MPVGKGYSRFVVVVGRRAGPASFGWDDGWSRPRGHYWQSGARSGPCSLWAGGPKENRSSIRRVKPSRNYPFGVR